MQTTATHSRLFIALVAIIWLCAPGYSHAQASASATSATRVSAELTKGKLNPDKSKPGDEVVLKVKDEVRSNGKVVLKKGTEIRGVVRGVQRVESRTDANAQSFMQIDWLVPDAEGGASQQLNVALESLTYISPLQRESSMPAPDLGVMGSGSGSARSSGGGLLGGAVGASAGAVGGVLGSTAATVGAGSSTVLGTTAAASGRSNVALMNMPSIVAADAQTTSSLQHDFGLSNSGDPLFRTGSGQVISAGGSRHALDIYSHMSNDTVLTSPSKDFEISSGAEMQMLVGIRKQ